METEEEIAARLKKEAEEQTGLIEVVEEEDENIKLLRQMVTETNQRARNEEIRRIQLEEEIRQLRNKPTIPENKATDKDYWDNPLTVMRKEISDQVKPLVEFTQKMERNQTYNNLKQQFLADPHYGTIVSQLGVHLDNVMVQLDPTAQNMANAIDSLLGRIARTNPEFFASKKKEETKTKEEKEKEKEMLLTPPHLRPSGAPKKESDGKLENKKNYSENERRLMKEQNLTEEQWEAALNAPTNLSTMRKKK